MEEIKIRGYNTDDYNKVRRIYLLNGWFDKVTDSKAGLSEKIRRDKDSLLVATKKNEVVGTVSIIEDGRIALLFRLLASKDEEGEAVRSKLMKEAERILKKKKYKQVHIICASGDGPLHIQYQKQGYNKGNLYRWFWKKIR